MASTIREHTRGVAAAIDHELGTLRSGAHQHLGLLGLRKRLALDGGSLEAEASAQQGGITVYARIPL
jgi:signal transduction histidine kinase